MKLICNTTALQFTTTYNKSIIFPVKKDTWMKYTKSINTLIIVIIVYCEYAMYISQYIV